MCGCCNPGRPKEQQKVESEAEIQEKAGKKEPVLTR